MYDIVALGELLIDFTEAGTSASGQTLFERNPGGAPANVLAVAVKRGLKTGFIGKVGCDAHGAFLRDTLQQLGIDTAGLQEDERYFTTLAFVSLDRDGDRSFSFARKPGADTQLSPDELNREMLQGCRIFHFGSLSLTDSPAAEATLEAIACAGEAGAVISYDPNYRPLLWCDESTASVAMRSVLPLVDVIKLSLEELPLLTGETEPAHAATALLAQGVQLVAVTLGAAGAYLATREHSVLVTQQFDVPVVDTTGAGDSFWGGVLSELLLRQRAPAVLSRDELWALGEVGNAVASCCVQRRGALLSMPDESQIKTCLQQEKL